MHLFIICSVLTGEALTNIGRNELNGTMWVGPNNTLISQLTPCQLAKVDMGATHKLTRSIPTSFALTRSNKVTVQS